WLIPHPIAPGSSKTSTSSTPPSTAARSRRRTGRWP
ncbi:MAG: hypothetical protein AVDCRST_MAG65-178, partial [uncultured Solirubrobacteraceae bacterium]